jgi:SNF2 family DNA or RNA helicase
VQVILFHEFTMTGQMICDVLTKRKISHGWLYGGSKNSSQIVRDFQDGKIQMLVSNSAKGGLSITLPQADYVLFVESPVDPKMRKQAENRPMARGDRTLMIDDLVASGVDRRIQQFLKEGKNLMAALARERRNMA